MTRAQKRAERYITAGRPVLDHRGEVIRPAEVAVKSRRARIERAIAMREGGRGSKPVNDQTGVGYRSAR